MPIEPGIEKTLYKIIKKKTGRKVDLLAAFKSMMISEIGVTPGLPIPMMCCIDEDTLWMVDENSAFPIPLTNLNPRFVKHSKGDLTPTSFEFELLTNGKSLVFKPTDSSKGPNNFWLWITILAERNKYNWWQ